MTFLLFLLSTKNPLIVGVLLDLHGICFDVSRLSFLLACPILGINGVPFTLLWRIPLNSPPFDMYLTCFQMDYL